MALIVIETSADPARPVNGAVLVDALWTAVSPDDAIEHISVRCYPRRIAVGVFSKDEERSSTVARNLVERACAMSPILRGAIAGDPLDSPIESLIRLLPDS